MNSVNRAVDTDVVIVSLLGLCLALSGVLAARALFAAGVVSVGLFDLGLTLDSSLAARALFVNVDVGSAVARILHFLARTAFTISRWRLLAAAIVLASLACCLLFSATASGSSGVAWGLHISRNRVTVKVGGIVGRATCRWLSMALEQTQACSDAAQTLVYAFLSGKH